MTGLERLASITAKDGSPEDIGPILTRALGYSDLAEGARRRLRASAACVASLDRTVLGHGDMSPQNVHCSGHELVGLVDWECAETRYLPGVDVWVAAVSYAEHCLGLVRWSDAAAVAAFDAGWRRSALYSDARAAARSAVRATGLDDTDAEALEIVFFGLRLGHRVAEPGTMPTSAGAAARMLEIAASG